MVPASQPLNWNAIGALGQWFAGVATLAVIGYMIWQDSFRRPKLLLGFDNERDVKSQSNTVGLPPTVLSRWLRVRVTNGKHRRVAEASRAYLIGIKKIGPNGQHQDAFPNDVRPLGWTHDPPGSAGTRDLLPGVDHWVDVAAASDAAPDLQVCVQPGWVLQDPGDYLITVQVSAKGAAPEKIDVLVHWGGTWQSLRGERAK